MHELLFSIPLFFSFHYFTQFTNSISLLPNTPPAILCLYQVYQHNRQKNSNGRFWVLNWLSHESCHQLQSTSSWNGLIILESYVLMIVHYNWSRFRNKIKTPKTRARSTRKHGSLWFLMICWWFATKLLQRNLFESFKSLNCNGRFHSMLLAIAGWTKLIDEFHQMKFIYRPWLKIHQVINLRHINNININIINEKLRCYYYSGKRLLRWVCVSWTQQNFVYSLLDRPMNLLDI